MKKIVVTNNKKVEERYSNKVEVVFVENGINLDVLQEGRKKAEKGANILQDPARNITDYYKSLVFFVEEESTPDEKSIDMLDKAIDALNTSGKIRTADKKPLLAGIMQNKDLDTVKKILD